MVRDMASAVAGVMASAMAGHGADRDMDGWVGKFGWFGKWVEARRSEWGQPFYLLLRSFNPNGRSNTASPTQGRPY